MAALGPGGEPDDKLTVLGDPFYVAEVPLERWQVIQVPIGDQAQLATGMQRSRALFEQVPPGIIIHRMIQVKGGVTQDQVYWTAFIVQQAIPVVKAAMLSCHSCSATTPPPTCTLPTAIASAGTAWPGCCAISQK